MKRWIDVRRVAALAGGIVVVGLVAVSLAAQGPAPGGAPAGGRAAAPPPPPQTGHPSGKLVIWGDTAWFDVRQNPENCILLSRFKRGMRMGWRITAIDGGTGETENTAVITAHLTYNSKTKGRTTVDIPMRWRGGAPPNAPAPNGYLRVPRELWTGYWTVPDDAETGMLTYQVTAVDRFGRTASFIPFPDIGSQPYVVD